MALNVNFRLDILLQCQIDFCNVTGCFVSNRSCVTAAVRGEEIH